MVFPNVNPSGLCLTLTQVACVLSTLCLCFKLHAAFCLFVSKFVENVLNKAIHNGAEKLTMVQKRFGNRQHVEDIYRTAMNINNMDVRVNVIEPTSFPVEDDPSYSHEPVNAPIQFSAQKLQARFSPMFG